ncbi:hypothetical protein N9W34_06825 [Rickettsiales bacterium]|nr:hypothetical protein [Rickettsiales bacterium]
MSSEHDASNSQDSETDFVDSGNPNVITLANDLSTQPLRDEVQPNPGHTEFSTTVHQDFTAEDIN